MTALKTKAGYGIFEAYLERSLLWVRSEGSILTPIKYASDRNVPSWSWMTYEGRISYLEAPFDKVAWTKDYESPFTSDDDQSFWEANGNYPTPALRSKAARKLSTSFFSDPVFQESIILDLPSKTDQTDVLRCIILGKEKIDGPMGSTKNYVMVVAPTSPKRNGTYTRVGVGVIRNIDICWDGEEKIDVY